MISESQERKRKYKALSQPTGMMKQDYEKQSFVSLFLLAQTGHNSTIRTPTTMNTLKPHTQKIYVVVQCTD
jgi:hypothetical protein